jgi:hypothetical protein
MQLLVWTSSLALAGQLAFTAAPHPYGVPHKQAATFFGPHATLPQADAAPKSRVVCGTVLLEANPDVDPRMTAEPRHDVTFLIRAYPRPACGKSK